MPTGKGGTGGQGGGSPRRQEQGPRADSHAEKVPNSRDREGHAPPPAAGGSTEAGPLSPRQGGAGPRGTAGTDHLRARIPEEHWGRRRRAAIGGLATVHGLRGILGLGRAGGAKKHGCDSLGTPSPLIRHKEQPKPAPTRDPGPQGCSPDSPGVRTSLPDSTAPPSPGFSFLVWFGHPQLYGGRGFRRGPEPGRVNTTPGPALVVIN